MAASDASPPPLVALLGDTLVAKSTSPEGRRFTTLRTADVLTDGYVGLLFSNAWSAEGRALCAAAEAAQTAVRLAGHAFTVVLVSSDNNVDEFERALGSLVGVPYTQALQAKEAQLCALYALRRVPELVVLDGTACVVNKAVSISRLTLHSAFPWTPPSVRECLRGEWLPASVAPGGGDSLSPAAHVLLLFATARQLREAAGAAHLGATAVASLCSGLAATPFDPKRPPPFVEPLLIPAKEEAEERSADVAAGLARSPPLGVWRHVPAGAEGRDRLASLRSLFPLQTHAAAKLASPRLVLLAPGTLKVLNNDAARALRNGFSPFPWLPRQAVDLDGDKRGWEGDPMAPGTSLLLILGKGLVASANAGEAKAALLAAAEAAAAVLDASPGPRLRVCVSSAADASQLGRAARRAARRGELGAEQHHAKNGEEQPGGAQVAPPTDDPDVVFVDLSREGGMCWAAPGVDALDPKALAAAGQAFRSGQLPSPPRPCGLVASITLAAALSNPSAEDLSPTGTRHAGGLERLVQLALCPVACPLLCVARSCAQPPGCGLLAFLSGGSGSGAMYAAEAAGAGP